MPRPDDVTIWSSSKTFEEPSSSMETEVDPPKRGPVSKLDTTLSDRSPRFSRTSSAIRKASATCSRRSSISSVHSHHSAVSTHGGLSSPTLAQHLRRASIIETRKARLADKAVHAEKVRLRAALAKASSRSTCHEERAVAAQATRERLLAEIAAKCEEQVRRAKKIAEENREKKAAEHARLKEEMSEKLAEAARRRNLYQRTGRRARSLTQTIPSCANISRTKDKILSEEEAARVVQRVWRYYRFCSHIQAFQRFDISISSSSCYTFDSLGHLLSDDTVLSTTTRLLNILGLNDPHESSAQDITSSTRIFLSSFLIVAFPHQILSNGSQDPHEQNLVSKAQDLLQIFEQCLNNRLSFFYKSQTGDSDRDLLLTAFAEFSSVFRAWKSHDSSNLVQIMISQFVELDLILQTVKDDHAGGVSEDYTSAIRQNQIQILARLKKFLGSEEALAMVKAAVRKARKAQKSKQRQPSSLAAPRAISDAGADSTDYLNGSTSGVERSGLTGKDQTPSTVWPGESLASAFQRIMTPIPPNREISHEIQINGTYEIEQSVWTEPRQQVMETICAKMRQALSEGGDRAKVDWTQSMAVMIREKLLALVPPRHPLYEKLDQILDLQLIHQTASAGLFSYDDFFINVASIIAQICSQGRDEIVKAFTDERGADVIERLLKLISILDLMTLDHINYGMRAAAPIVLDHGYEHEHKAFERDMLERKHTLTKLRRFWTLSRRALGDNLTSINGNAVYNRGVVDLVLSNQPLRYSSLPETLHLDWHRLSLLRAQAFRTVAAASILLTTKIRLRRNRETQWKDDADRITSLDFATVDAVRILSVIESSHLMPESTREGVLNFVKRVLPSASAATKNCTLIAQTLGASRLDRKAPSPLFDELDSTLHKDVFSEQVATYMLKTLRDHVFDRLSATSVADRVRTTTNAVEVLGRAGMPEFSADVIAIVDVLGRVKKVDLKSHERWYDEVAGGSSTSSEQAR